MDTKSIVYIALFAALTAALALFPPITLPGGVPITAQSLGVMLAGSLAGARRGSLAMVLFLVLIAVGLPLLAGGRGGIGMFFGPSGGFLLAWPVSAFFIGWALAKANSDRLLRNYVIIAFGGIIVMYAIGIPWLAATTEMSLSQAMFVMLAYVPGDLIKAFIAAVITRQVRKAFPL